MISNSVLQFVWLETHMVPRFVTQDVFDLFKDVGSQLWKDFDCLQVFNELFPSGGTKNDCRCVWVPRYPSQGEG